MILRGKLIVIWRDLITLKWPNHSQVIKVTTSIVAKGTNHENPKISKMKPADATFIEAVRHKIG